MVIPPMAEYQEDINLLNQTMFDYLHNENKLLNEAAMHLVSWRQKDSSIFCLIS